MNTYDLVISHDLKNLIEIVNMSCEHGYTPIGGVIFFEGQFIQTIYKPINQPT